jgi:predicted Zn-dependent peptidase
MAGASLGLPWHPHLKREELSNGMKIVMLPNQYPKDRFFMYLDVNVGSTCEDEDQQGIGGSILHSRYRDNR